MKAAFLTADLDIEIRETSAPVPGETEVLVKIAQCGICTLEQRLYTGDMRIGYPLIPGHEASGTVVSVGTHIHSSLLQPGDTVALDLITRCGTCHFCRIGQSNLCENRFNGRNGVLGGFGEYVAVPASQVYRVPPGTPYGAAALAEPLSCAIHALKKIRLKLGEDLLILGAGPMGMLNLLTARAMGARVLVVDPNGSRRLKAAELGAAGVFDPFEPGWLEQLKAFTDGRGADAVIITAQTAAALEEATGAVSEGGRIILFTSYTDPPLFSVDANTLHRGEYLITGSEGRTEQDFYQAVRLISGRIVTIDPLISAVYAFERIEEAMQAALSEDTYRIMVAFGELL